MQFTIDEKNIRDEYGRQRIFKGINLCYKFEELCQRSKKEIKKELKDFDSLIIAMKENGINLIRLGFTWAMIEPKENSFDKMAIDFLHTIIKKCQESNIYVILDNHQDLFFCNKGFGDGAPIWVSEEYTKKRPLLIWAEGYFYMKGVQKAFNDFWNNKNDFQKKFIKYWNHIINEFNNYDNIIAYDYLNEPMINDHANDIFCRIIDNALKTGLNIDFNAKKYFENGKEKLGFAKMALAIVAKIRSIKNLKIFLSKLSSYESFSNLLNGTANYVEDFNQKYYQSFFSNMITNCGDDKHFNLFEHSYFSNLGIPFSIKCNTNSIYSPHAYDIFIDSPLYNKYSSNERIRYIIDHIKENQDKMNIPVIMGEWGGHSKIGSEWIKHIDYVYSLLENNQWSNIYWNYRFKNKKFTKIMNRPYPIAICGDIINYKSDSNTRTFEIEFNTPDICFDCFNEIYVPSKGVVKYEAKTGYNKIEINY